MESLKNPQNYHGMKYRIFFGGIFLDIVLLIFLLYGGLTFEIRDWVQSLVSENIISDALYVWILGFLVFVLHFPLNYFSGYVWEHRYGLSTQTLGKWWLEHLKKSMMGLSFAAILISVIYLVAGYYADNWWIVASIIWTIFNYILARWLPVLIIPLFYKYSEVDNLDLKDRIHALFKRCGTVFDDVYAVDFSKKTYKANAFVCGFGSTRRVVLSDTLLSKFTDEEVETVVAHELGHHRHHDLTKLFAVNAVFIFLGLYVVHRVLSAAIIHFKFNSINDIASLPLAILCLSVLGIILAPLMNWMSRRAEVAADRYSLQITGNPDAFISMMTKLGSLNLSETQPHWLIKLFFYDHPPISQRLAFAQKFKKANE